MRARVRSIKLMMSRTRTRTRADPVWQVFFSVTFMGMAAGMAGAIAPDIAKGKPALIAIFKLIDQVGEHEKARWLTTSDLQKPKIDANDPSGQKPSSVSGEIELRDVSFTYPARPDVKIFEHLNLSKSLLAD
eukprot:764532-Hanusia_phi.AAC.2